MQNFNFGTHRELQSADKIACGPRPLHGAALVYALVATVIIAVLILGIGRLVGGHLANEETSSTYNRLIYSAEAAANWQLNQMSRLTPDGADQQPGETLLTDFNRVPVNINNNAAWTHLSADALGGDALQDETLVYTVGINSGSTWERGINFKIYAYARDQESGLMRGVTLDGAGTGISDQYSIFGRDKITFDSVSSTAKCTLARAYVGSNGTISYTNAIPPDSNQSPGPSDPVFSGVLLNGPAARMSPPVSGWQSGWDIPRLPDTANFPTIAAIMRGVYGKTISDVVKSGSANANMYTIDGSIQGSIQYFDSADGKFHNFTTPITKLTNAEFEQSTYKIPTDPLPYHIIRLQTKVDEPHGNLFVFNSIQMGSHDILLLHKLPPRINGPLGPETIATSCRILINNDGLASDNVVTNVGLFQITDAGSTPTYTAQDGSYHIWYNNTNRGLTFMPNLNPKTFPMPYLPPLSGIIKNIYALAPGIPGMAYGIRDNGAGSPTGGSVTVVGRSDFVDFPVNIVTAIATQVTIKGKVTVSQIRFPIPVSGSGANFEIRKPYAEAENDPFRYIIYYRVIRNYAEINVSDPIQYQAPFRDYGTAP